jgi:hypothetical protein
MLSYKDTQCRRRAACTLLLATGIGPAATAHDAQARFAVTATVTAVVRVALQSAPNLIEISAADVERGFIDVSEPMRLQVYANSPGCTLDVVTVAPMISSMILKGLGSDQRLGAEGGTVVERWAAGAVPRGPADLALRFRFILAPQVSSGRYPWPVRIFVRPLEIPGT